MSFTHDRVRAQFSALHQSHDGLPVTFFDGPGGSQVPESVLEAMMSYLGHHNSNLGAPYISSQITSELVASAREACRTFLNAPSADSIVFGANMTSLTFSLSRAISRQWQAGDEIVVTELDHYANVSSWRQAAEDKSVVVKTALVDESDCSLDIEHMLSLITPKTRLVAVTLASNVSGSIIDISSIVSAAKQVGAIVYVDAVHYAPHHLIDVQKLECDFLVCSAYKFFGPHIGVAYIAPPWLEELTPYKVEPAPANGPGRFETGTQSFEALAGLVACIDYLAQWGEAGLSLRQRLEQSYAFYNQYETQLSSYFLQQLAQRPHIKLWGRHSADSQQRTSTFALTFEQHASQAVAQALGQQNLCTSNGHFYALGLIRQLGLEQNGGVVRIGLMHYSTVDEIDRLFEQLDALTQ